MKKFISFISSKFFWFNVLAAVIIATIICFGVMFWLDSYTRHGESVMVPKVTGLYEQEAELLLRDLSLSYEIIDSVHRRNLEPGEIVEQTPGADSFVKKHRKIYITVNARSPKMVIFNDYRGYSFRKAQSNYRNQGYIVDSIRFVPSEYSGELIDVEYKNEIVTRGQKLPEAAKLVLIVGQLDNSQQTIMPSLYGLSLADAKLLVRDSALIVGAVNFDEDVLDDEDRMLFTVYGQEPKEGTIVYEGKRVDIYLSKDKNKSYSSTSESEEDFF